MNKGNRPLIQHLKSLLESSATPHRLKLFTLGHLKSGKLTTTQPSLHHLLHNHLSLVLIRTSSSLPNVFYLGKTSLIRSLIAKSKSKQQLSSSSSSPSNLAAASSSASVGATSSLSSPSSSLNSSGGGGGSGNTLGGINGGRVATDEWIISCSFESPSYYTDVSNTYHYGGTNIKQYKHNVTLNVWDFDGDEEG